MARMIYILTKWEDKGKLKYMSISEVRCNITLSKNKFTFYQFTEEQIKDQKIAKRIGNARVYQHTLNAVKNFPILKIQ